VRSRILIADDHADVRGALRALLERHPDWKVCAEAVDGLEGLQKAVELKPDLVVVDFLMPGMGGLEAARKISLATPGVPILLYTVCDFPPEFKVEARKLGVWNVINKNTPPEQLVSAVEALLDWRHRYVAEMPLPEPNPPEVDPQSGAQPA
jgi:two-component system, NarL family, nitrate/nitrite response regulator NarL